MCLQREMRWLAGVSLLALLLGSVEVLVGYGIVNLLLLTAKT